MIELFMRTFSSSFSSAQHPGLPPHSAGWWLGNLLTSGRMSMDLLPPFSLLILSFSSYIISKSELLWNENYISCETVGYSRFSTKSYKMWVCIVVYGETSGGTGRNTRVSPGFSGMPLPAPVPTLTSLCTTDCRTLRGNNQNALRTDNPLTSKKKNSQSETEECCFGFF